MRNFFRSIWKFFIRTTAFVRREVFSIIRQPQLLLTLVLGPFLILLIFGIGYRNEARALRTLFVAEEGSELRSRIEEIAPNLGPQLIYLGILSDPEAALQRLRDGEADLVVIAPEHAIDAIRNGEQANFRIYHQEIDPFQADYVTYFGQTYIDEVNRRILRDATLQGQEEAENLQGDLAAAEENATAAKEALQKGDELSARYRLARMGRNVDQVSLAAGASLAVLSSVEESVGEENDPRASEVMQLLAELQGLNSEVQEGELTENNQSEWEGQLDEILANLDELQVRLETFSALDPEVIMSPFTSTTLNVSAVQPNSTGFYAPAVLALLIQHLVLTTAALSTVQDRSYGTMELFRVSPLTSIEVLLGKYLSFLLFGAVIALLLSLLLHVVLSLPMLGSWVNYIIVIAALMFTSLGFGFLISLVSKSDSQAVQYTMIVLLVSVFFSGFIMDLNYFLEPVKILSWSIPTTYGTVMLREIALRGNVPDLLPLIGLALIGLVAFLLSWVILSRQMSNK